MGMRPIDTPIGPGSWLEHLLHHVPAAHAGHDPEAVHEIRVGVARLRVWLELGGWQVLRGDLRWLREEAAFVRDVDVQLEQHPPDVWAAYLRGRRASGQRRLRRALNSDRCAGVTEALRAMPPVSRVVAWRVVARLAEGALGRGRALRRRTHDIHALHALRCAARHVRYALEWLGEDSTRLTALQQALGEVCDRHVALEGLRRSRAGGRQRRYRRRLERELDHFVDCALAAWKTARPDLKELRHAALRHPSR